MDSITIRDIAKYCGVSTSTISRAINNHPDVKPEKRELILETIREHNFVPNNSARNLKRNETKTIAIIVKSIDNTFFSKMIQIMEREIRKKRYSMILHHVISNEDVLDAAMELAKEKKLSGIIFLGGFFHHSEEKLRQLKIPFMLCTSNVITKLSDRSFYSSISVDDEKESYRMVKYLIEQGHQDIAIIASSRQDTTIGMLRLEGYKRALSESGIPIRKELILYNREDFDEFSFESAYLVTKAFLEKNYKCSAIYAICDILAIGAARALLEAGKKIPTDYAVAGFDDIEIGRYYSPSITTMKQPGQEMAMATVKSLFEVIIENASHRHMVFPTELLVKESTASLVY